MPSVLSSTVPARPASQHTVFVGAEPAASCGVFASMPTGCHVFPASVERESALIDGKLGKGDGP
jgi:hypothetical protein